MFRVLYPEPVSGPAPVIEFKGRRRYETIGWINMATSLFGQALLLLGVNHNEATGKSAPRYILSLSILCFVVGAMALSCSRRYKGGITDREALRVLGRFCLVAAIQYSGLIAGGVLLRNIWRDKRDPSKVYYYLIRHNPWIANSVIFMTSLHAVCVFATTYAGIILITVDLIELSRGAKGRQRHLHARALSQS